MTDVINRETGEVLAYEVRIEAPPDVVWAFWVDPERLVRWMGKTASLDPRPGGSFRLDYGTGDVASGSYVEVDAPRRLVMTWGWEAASDAVQPGASRVEVELEPDGDAQATILRLRHFGLPPDSRKSHDEGWAHFLARLVASATTSPGDGDTTPQK